MEKKDNNLKFKIMANIGLPIRDIFMPPKKMFSEIGIKEGQNILDFGCGPGIFTIMAAKKTGASGVVYALDIQMPALKVVEKKAKRNGLTNIKTIHSNGATSLASSSIDTVIFFDVFHAVKNKNEVLAELHRIMKPDAIMSFSDHHMNDGNIIEYLTKNKLFKLIKKGDKTFNFCKV